jgi:integrase/recombinase XerD
MQTKATFRRRKGSAADIPDRIVSLALSQARAQSNHAERNVAMILVSCGLGLRAGEISQLLWKFVLDDDGKIGKVLRLPNEIAKWKSGADLPISKSLQSALETLYKAQSKEHPIAPTDHTFASQKGSGLSRQSVVDLFRLIWRKAGVDASSHSGRRFFITKAARNVSAVGGSLRDVMALARHKHLSTTQLYVAQNTKAQTALVDLVSRGIK